MFTMYLPSYQVSGDTVSYYLTGKKIVETGHLTDEWRTPIYPLILIAPFVARSKPLPESLPMSEFSKELWFTRVLQSVSAVCMILMMFFILRYLSKSDIVAGITCFVISCNWTLLLNEFGMYTEAFATLCLVSTIGIQIVLLRKFTIPMFLVFLSLSIFSAFLRPFYVFLPFLLVSLIWWHHKTRHVAIWCMYGLIGYSAVLFFYTQANGILYQYHGMSRISDINLIGKIFEYSLPLSTHPSDAKMKGIIEQFQRTNTIQDPWYIMIQNPMLYSKVYSDTIHEFAIRSILQSPVTYIYKSMRDIPTALLSTPHLPQNIYRTTNFASVFSFLELFGNMLQKTYAISLISVLFFLLEVIKRKSVQSMAMLSMVLVCWYQVLMSVFGSYNDFARLLSCSIPLSFAVIAMVLYKSITQVKRSL